MSTRAFETSSKFSLAGNRGGGTLTLPTSRADIAVRERPGAEASVLLIHGDGESKEIFEHLFASDFAAGRHLIAFDLPGHGRSGEPYDSFTACTIEAYADLALEVLERLGVESAFVVDRWRGGSVGRELMTIFPGMLGLAIVGREPDLGAEPEVEPIPVVEVDGAANNSLELVISCLCTCDAALQRAPLAWYGG